MQAFRQRDRARIGSEESHLVKEQGLTFVLEGVGHLNGQDRPPNVVRTKQDQDSKESKGDKIVGTLASTRFGGKAVSEPKANSHPRYTTQDLNLLVLLPQEISAAHVSRQQLASNAVCAFSPVSQDCSIGPHWSQTIPDLVNRDVILDFSIQALCLMQISHINQERWLLHRSLQYYDRALKALQRALARKTETFQQEIFAATMALGGYELLQGTNARGRGWLSHIEGATAYLKTFPSLNVCAFGQQLSFHFLETICIFDALGSRKPSHFSSSQWWRDSVDRYGGEAYGSLLRMLTTLPSVLEQCDSAASLPPTPEALEERTRLLRLCLRLENAFLAWHQRTLDSSNPPSPCPSPTPTSESRKRVGPLQPTPATAPFQTLHTARLYLLYWSSTILLSESITTLLSTLHPSSFPLDVLSATTYTTTAHSLATSILGSVPFCLRPEHGIVGKTLVLLPLYIAGKHFSKMGDWEGARRCEDLLVGMGQGKLRFGVRVGREG